MNQGGEGPKGSLGGRAWAEASSHFLERRSVTWVCQTGCSALLEMRLILEPDRLRGVGV